VSDACDFSQSHPSVAQLRAAGKVCVIAKINGPNAISAAEVAAYVAAGIVVCFYYEVTATDMLGGWAGGVAAAKAANTLMWALLGLGAYMQPVYFAADQNIVLANTSLLQAATGYFVGLASVRAASANGVYGNGSFLDWLGATGLASYFWQSSSSSYEGNGSTIPAAHIRQLVGAAIGGTDDDQLLKGDVGQYPRPA
jgi:hypothetical protein